MFDFSHIITAAGTWILAHVSAPTIQIEIDKLRGRTNGARRVGKLSVAELRETLRSSLGEVMASQAKSLESIAKTNELISTNTAILVDRSR